MAQLLLRGELLGTIKGVLFDKDGTLSHSEPRLVEQGLSRIEAACDCWRDRPSPTNDSGQDTSIEHLRRLLHQAYGLNDQCVRPDGLLAVASRQHNLVATATVFSLLGHSWPQALVMATDSFRQASAARHSASTPDGSGPSPLLPAARECLDQLQAAGVVCAVISNDTKAGIDAFLNHHGLNRHITAVWSAEDLPSKPDPAAVHALCENLGLEPSQCALIGDADSDLLMAREAGIGHGLGYVAGWTQSPDLSAHDHLIQHWNELGVAA